MHVQNVIPLLSSFFINFLSADAVQDCSAHGVSINSASCACDPGWIGPNCDKLDFIPQLESPFAYTQGVADSWGGTVFNNSYPGVQEYFFIGSRLTQPPAPGGRLYSDGMIEWPFGAVCSISVSSIPTGNFTYISDLSYGDKTQVLWSENCRAIVQCIPKHAISGQTECAFKIYYITKKSIKNGSLQNAFYGIPEVNSKTGYAAKFPKNLYNQGLFLSYYKLKATTSPEINKEISALLKNSQPVINVNGYAQNTKINTKFNALDLDTKIPNPFVNSVNPAPLVNSRDNTEASVEYEGSNYTVTFYRYWIKNECLAVLTAPANQFIWEEDVTYTNGQDVCYADKNIEDPFCWETDKSISCLVHDESKICGSNSQACGSMITFPNNIPGVSIVNPTQNSYWSKNPTVIYDDNISNLEHPIYSRQRPTLLFYNGIPRQLNTGIIWDGKFVKEGKATYWQGLPSKSFPVQINARAAPTPLIHP